jgi:SAM-dependent methyltransferase
LETFSRLYGINMTRSSPIEVPNIGRNELAHLFATLGFKSGVEIGVQLGQFTEILALTNPQASVVGVDPWAQYDDYFESDAVVLDAQYERAKARLAKYPNVTLVRKTSMDAVKDVPLDSLDFVYIDGNHELLYAVSDMKHWSARVRVGGIVAGHDYTRYVRQNNMHALQAVHAFTDSYRITPWFILGLKNPSDPKEIRDKVRSFMWVKRG